LRQHSLGAGRLDGVVHGLSHPIRRAGQRKSQAFLAHLGITLRAVGTHYTVRNTPRKSGGRCPEQGRRSLGGGSCWECGVTAKGCCSTPWCPSPPQAPTARRFRMRGPDAPPAPSPRTELPGWRPRPPLPATPEPDRKN
jgi:hypothetical protein